MTHDDINSPSHYTTLKDSLGIEVIDLIEAMSWGYHLGNVVKYLFRHEYKGTPVKDLHKARWYLDRAIELAEEDAEDAAAVAAYMDEPNTDAYGRALRASPPVNIDGETLEECSVCNAVLDPDLDYDRSGALRCDECYGEDPEAVFLNLPFNGRVAGQGAPELYDDFYNFDRNEVIADCWNGCGETILNGDLHLTHTGKPFCSTSCVEEFKKWQGGER